MARMYVIPNFQTHKELREAVANKRLVTLMQTILEPCPFDGIATVKGPHHPGVHFWDATVRVSNGRIVEVLD